MIWAVTISSGRATWWKRQAALLAAGAHEDARRVLSYLQATQQPDGHWPQNMWLDGSPYWDGIQMDETALPILLVDLAHREKALADGDVARFWPMVRQAAGYLVRNGPVSPQDRWEEDPGYSPFTVGGGNRCAPGGGGSGRFESRSVHCNLPPRDRRCLEYIHRTLDVCVRHGLVPEVQRRRVLRPDRPDGRRGKASSRFQKNVHVKNVSAAEDTRVASHLVSPDALALVRFGLRAADDPRICDTAKVIDALTQGGDAVRPVLASLQRRWLWRA